MSQSDTGKPVATSDVSTLKRPQGAVDLVHPDVTLPASKRARVSTSAEISGPSQTTDPQQAIKEPSAENAILQPKTLVEPTTTDKTDSKPSQKGKGRKGKDKDDQKKGRRDSRRGTRVEGAEESDGPKAPRLPKRQCALLIGFCGAGYSGMQIQPTVRTIEGELFQALVKAGAVSQDNADDPVKVNLARAARTDAGVHAAGNVVTMKLITAVPGVPDLVARVNEELPPEIRLWAIARAQNSFNGRSSCDSRKYTYFFPSYLLLPPKPSSGLYRTFQSQISDTLSPPLHPFWAEAGSESTREDDLRRKRQWRTTPDLVEALRKIVAAYEGTHNFHNFTVGRDFGDRSNMRHMKKIEVAHPVVYGETEWISILFHGQSFMLHQRKMMCALVLACRTCTPPQIIEELYGPRQVFIPKMPALGLLLEYPIFETYNRKVAAINEKLDPSHAEFRPLIDFEEHREDIDKFKQEYIYSGMRSVEDRDGIFDAWVLSIDQYAGDDLLYLNPKGIIPAAAVRRKGEKRSNPFRERKKFDVTSFPLGGSKAELDDEEYSSEADEALDKKKLTDMEG